MSGLFLLISRLYFAAFELTITSRRLALPQQQPGCHVATHSVKRHANHVACIAVIILSRLPGENYNVRHLFFHMFYDIQYIAEKKNVSVCCMQPQLMNIKSQSFQR